MTKMHGIKKIHRQISNLQPNRKSNGLDKDERNPINHKKWQEREKKNIWAQKNELIIGERNRTVEGRIMFQLTAGKIGECQGPSDVRETDINKQQHPNSDWSENIKGMGSTCTILKHIHRTLMTNASGYGFTIL